MEINRIKKGEKYLGQVIGELCNFHDFIADQDGLQIILDSNAKIVFIPINKFKEDEQFLFELMDEIKTLSNNIKRSYDTLRFLSEKLLNSKYKNKE
jgi:hypothetical protein